MTEAHATRETDAEWNAEALRVIDAGLAFGIDDDLRDRMRALIASASHEMFEAAFPLPPWVTP